MRRYIQILPLLFMMSVISIYCLGNYTISPFGHNSIEGTWEESFTWISGYHGIWIEDSIICETIDRTSKISFTRDEFIVKILPPRRTILVVGDSVYSGFADDTLYTGYYQIDNDTLYLKRDTHFQEDPFIFNIKHDTLSIRRIVIADTGQLMMVPINHFIWANSFNKISGNFVLRD
jgi:hypothetical protein